MSYAIGIDFGTSSVSAAVYRNGKVEVILNDKGNRSTPSIVAFPNEEDEKRMKILFGEAAKNKLMSSKNKIHSVKRLLGRSYDDPKVQKLLKLWSFKVVNDQEHLKIQLNETKNKFPYEITTILLAEMKEMAHRQFGETVENAVITVPAFFTDGQRQSMMTAARLANVNVLQIINEPSAAAVAFQQSITLKENINVVIFDLGGGTCDVSVLTFENKSRINTIGTAGDTFLGGEDFDNRIIVSLAKEFKEKNNEDPLSNDRALTLLRRAAEEAKRELSSNKEAFIEIDCLLNDSDFSTVITREQFEDLCTDLFEKAVDLVKEALKSANMDRNNIQEIVLVGGSTRIPKIQQMLQNFFGKTPNCSIHPEEAVVAGAAMQAYLLNKSMTTPKSPQSSNRKGLVNSEVVCKSKNNKRKIRDKPCNKNKMKKEDIELKEVENKKGSSFTDSRKSWKFCEIWSGTKWSVVLSVLIFCIQIKVVGSSKKYLNSKNPALLLPIPKKLLDADLATRQDRKSSKVSNHTEFPPLTLPSYPNIPRGIDSNSSINKTLIPTSTRITSNLQSPKILLISDNFGQHLAYRVKNYLPRRELNFNVLGIVKYGATFNAITHGLENLVQNYTHLDFVIILGGSNDINNESLFPLKNISESLNKLVKLCFHTNVIIASIPYRYQRTLRYNNIDILKLNWGIKKILDQKDLPDIFWLDLQEIKKNYYTKNGRYLNRRGKNLLSKMIVEKITSILSAQS